MVGFLLSVTFACGLFVAVAHVVNRRFVAPVYDVVANLLALVCAAAASTLLEHWVPALLAAFAVCCWLALAVRTARALGSRAPVGAVEGAVEGEVLSSAPAGRHDA